MDIFYGAIALGIILGVMEVVAALVVTDRIAEWRTERRRRRHGRRK